MFMFVGSQKVRESDLDDRDIRRKGYVTGQKGRTMPYEAENDGRPNNWLSIVGLDRKD